MEYKILEHIIGLLDPIKSISDKDVYPNFGYGTKEDLNRYLDYCESNDDYKNSDGESKNTYPLIWLITPSKATSARAYFDLEWTPTLVIATKNDHFDMINKDRNNLTFKLILNPIYEDFKIKINQNALSKADKDTYSKYSHFNYTMVEDKDSDNTIIWDAIEFSVNLSLKSNNKCVLLQQ